MPRRDQVFEGVNSHLDMMNDSVAIDGIHALRGTVLDDKANMQGKPLSSSRVLAASSPTQPVSCCPGVAVSRRGAGVPQRPDMSRSELEDTSTSEVQRGKVNTGTGHSDRRCCPPKCSSLTLLPTSSRRALATSTPPQAQQISHCSGVAVMSRRGARDHWRPGTTRSELEILNPSALERGEVHTRTCQSDQLCQEEAATMTHIAPSADLADDLLVNGILPQLPDDLLVEILSRLPAKPVHRFKCVSKSWRDLISSPHHRKRLPQALAGFFYQSWCTGEKGLEEKLQFINLSLRGQPLINPALAFLPNYESIVLADCCNGLLLLFSSYSQPRDYIVCNPATEKWVVLPNSGVTEEHWLSRLAFDPAVSSHFHVVEYVDEVTHHNVGIFSSRTGGWSHIVKVSTGDLFLWWWPETVFLNGMLHFTCSREVMAIDLETKKWRHIQLPPNAHANSDFFGQSQGCLVYSSGDVDTRSFWTLQDYGSGAWKLKRRVSVLQVFDGRCMTTGGAFHPECNTVFYPKSLDKGISFMSYDLDRGELCHIAAPEFFCTSIDRLLPYVPFFGDIGI